MRKALSNASMRESIPRALELCRSDREAFWSLGQLVGGLPLVKEAVSYLSEDKTHLDTIFLGNY